MQLCISLNSKITFGPDLSLLWSVKYKLESTSKPQSDINFNAFRPKIRTTVFCGWCGQAKRSDKMKLHCETVHNAVDMALEHHEESKHPAYENETDYILSYHDVEPILKKDYVPWKQPDKKRSLNGDFGAPFPT